MGVGETGRLRDGRGDAFTFFDLVVCASATLADRKSKSTLIDRKANTREERKCFIKRLWMKLNEYLSIQMYN